MGRAPCCDKANVKRGPWSPEEDAKLKEYIDKNGTGGNWIALPNKVGLKRCGKSCRLRWLNYLRPNIKHGEFSDAEDKIICSLFASIGSRWSIIASQLPGRTDNDIKNYWNTKLKKKMMMAMNHSAKRKPQQVTHLPILQNITESSTLSFRDSNNSCYYPLGSFSGSGSFSKSNLISGNSTNSIFQAQGSFIYPTQFKASSSSTFVFGGETASCSSSSDGSCNNKISHATEPELGYGEGCLGSTLVEQIGGVNNYLYNGVEDTHKFMFNNIGGSASGWTEKQNGLWGENPLDYGIEEIKQLISTSSCNNFLFGDKKTEEEVMHY